MAVALLVAAGRGARLGGDRPKAFVSLAGRPMLEWSVIALRAVPAVSEVVIALPPGEQAPDGCVGVGGGETRSESVRAALTAAGPGEPVVVHDAARPLVTPALVESTIAALTYGVDGAIAGVPVTDTIKRADANLRVVETPDRRSLWAVQTPQTFRRAALERALSAPPEVLARATDDAWLVERTGATVRLVAAPEENLKVTTPLDLRLAELVLSSRAD